jgi:hypothetical protein
MVFISGGTSEEMNGMGGVILEKETTVVMVAGAFQIPTVEDEQQEKKYRKRVPPVSVEEGGRHVRREWGWARAFSILFYSFFIYFKILFSFFLFSKLFFK